MPGTSTVALHPQIGEINALLVAGAPHRDVADRFGLSKSAVTRHARNGLPRSMVRAREASEVASADALVAELKELKDSAVAVLDKAREAGDGREMLAAIKVARGVVETVAKLIGALQQDGAVSVEVGVRVDLDRMRAVIHEALADHPDAQRDVAEALMATYRREGPDP